MYDRTRIDHLPPKIHHIPHWKTHPSHARYQIKDQKSAEFVSVAALLLNSLPKATGEGAWWMKWAGDGGGLCALGTHLFPSPHSTRLASALYSPRGERSVAAGKQSVPQCAHALPFATSSPHPTAGISVATGCHQETNRSGGGAVNLKVGHTDESAKTIELTKLTHDSQRRSQG